MSQPTPSPPLPLPLTKEQRLAHFTFGVLCLKNNKQDAALNAFNSALSPSPLLLSTESKNELLFTKEMQCLFNLASTQLTLHSHNDALTTYETIVKRIVYELCESRFDSLNGFLEKVNGDGNDDLEFVTKDYLLSVIHPPKTASIDATSSVVIPEHINEILTLTLSNLTTLHLILKNGRKALFSVLGGIALSSHLRNTATESNKLPSPQDLYNLNTSLRVVGLQSVACDVCFDVSVLGQFITPPSGAAVNDNNELKATQAVEAPKATETQYQTEEDILASPTSAIAHLLQKVRLENGEEGVQQVLKMLRGAIQGEGKPAATTETTAVEKVVKVETKNSVKNKKKKDKKKQLKSIAKTKYKLHLIKYGTKYSVAYVNNLVSGALRNLSDEVKRDLEVVVYTDDGSGLCAGVSVVEITSEESKRGHPFDLLKGEPVGVCGKVSGWWFKALLFKPDGSKKNEGNVRNVYIDIDTIITNSITPMFTALFLDSACKFATLSTDNMVNENRSNGLNTSVMIWNTNGDGNSGNELSSIFTDLNTSFDKVSQVIYKFDHWIELKVRSAFSIDELTGCGCGCEVREYLSLDLEIKAHAAHDKSEGREGAVPSSVSVVTFPLEPKPEEVVRSNIGGWVERYWR